MRYLVNFCFYFFSILFFNLFIQHAAYANIIYKHTLPFTVKMEKGDTLTVSYDFSARQGIHCAGIGTSYQMRLMYKGHEKMIALPITLQSHHVPAQHQEVLADTTGKLMIEIAATDQAAAGEVFCDYV